MQSTSAYRKHQMGGANKITHEAHVAAACVTPSMARTELPDPRG